MNFTNYSHQHRLLATFFLGAIAYTVSIISSPMAIAKLFDGPVDRLPVLERAALREGKVILMGAEGEYTARILVTSSVDTAWQVLTDYNNFAEFLPGVATSELLESSGDRKVFEQINQIKTFIFSTKARVRVAVTESYPQQIIFSAIDGDLEEMDGNWLIEPVSPYPSAPPDSVLLTYKVSVEPASTPSDGIFYGIYEDSLEKTLTAIKQEAEKRFIQTQ